MQHEHNITITSLYVCTFNKQTQKITTDTTPVAAQTVLKTVLD